MPKPSPMPDSRSHETPGAKAPVQATGHAAHSPKVASVISSGPRKLIRPSLPAKTGESSRKRRPVLTAQEVRANAGLAILQDPSHAEMFYLKKQARDQTPMVFVLEDGERIEGYIEWYDRHAIKVRNGARTLIYKSSIKYLYKAVENSGVAAWRPKKRGLETERLSATPRSAGGFEQPVPDGPSKSLFLRQGT
jgi:sRNA-binding regulator protein Hfq